MVLAAVALAVLIGGVSVLVLWRVGRRGGADGPLGGALPSPLPVGGELVDPYRRRVGAWANGLTATWPLVALSFDERELRLRGAVNISVNRREAVALEPVRGLVASGFRVRTPTGRLDRVMVGAGADVLRVLAQRGWPVVDEAPKSISREMFRP
jgi:hypothetical protein